MENKVVQKAGENSQQIQVQTMVVNQGIEEKRAREIFMEMFEVTRKELTKEAEEKAMSRVRAFEDILIQKFAKTNSAMEQFADPAFQMLLTSAHKVAVSTEKNGDYLILTELLAHRVKRGNDRNSGAGIKKAIEIVGDIAEEALMGLTLIYSVEKIIPKTGVIEQGLEVLDNLFSKLIYDKLPEGKEWIENLAILNAIRITEYNDFSRVEDFYAQRLSGYSCVGIKKGTETYFRALEMLESKELTDVLIDHELNDGYVRLALVEKENIENLKRIFTDSSNGCETKEMLSDEEKDILYKVYEMYEKNEVLSNSIKNKLKNQIKTKLNLLKIIEWMGKIKPSFVITPIGRVLAHANAQKLEEGFPPLD